VADQITANNRSPSLIATTIYQLSAGEYVEACGWQDSGGALSIYSYWQYSPVFSMVRMP
jgi:hypothetical protein